MTQDKQGNGRNIINKSTLIPIGVVTIIIAGVWGLASDRTSIAHSIASNKEGVRELTKVMTQQSKNISEIKGSIIRIETHLRMNGHGARTTDP